MAVLAQACQPLPEQYWPRSLQAVKTVWFIILGNILEWYEFSVFGYLSTQIDVNFFRGDDLGTWAAFAVTFLVRPFGAVLFGYIADKKGRKLSVLLSLSGIIIGTVGQGCVPTYYCCGDEWGSIGIIMLLTFRVIQGLSTGGEIAGVSVFLAEYHDKQVLGFMSSSISFGGAFGFALSASVVSVLLAVLDEHQMNLWGWRIPFITCIVPGLISLALRWKHIEESADFVLAGLSFIEVPEAAESSVSEAPLSLPAPALKAKSMADMSINDPEKAFGPSRALPAPRSAFIINSIAEEDEGEVPIPDEKNVRPTRRDEPFHFRFPIVKVLFHMPGRFALGFFGMAAVAASWYVGSVYTVTYLQDYSGLTNQDALMMGVVNSIFSTIFTPVGGVLADTMGVGKTHVLSSAGLAVLVVPMWLVYIDANNMDAFFVMAAFSGAVQGVFCAIPYLYVAELFPTTVRASGFVSYNIGVTLFGGMGPLFAASLARIDRYGPLYYQLGVSILATAATGAAYSLYSARYFKPTNIRHHPY